MTILTQYLITLGWAVTAAVSMGLALALLIKLFAALTPINEWEELKKGNMAVAVVMASVILGASLVIALAIAS